MEDQKAAFVRSAETFTTEVKGGSRHTRLEMRGPDFA